jgi:hypothetical protein
MEKTSQSIQVTVLESLREEGVAIPVRGELEVSNVSLRRMNVCKEDGFLDLNWDDDVDAAMFRQSNVRTVGSHRAGRKDTSISRVCAKDTATAYIARD